MDDNTDKKTLDEPVNTQPENVQTDIISTKDTEPIIPNQKDASMEVHKHPHHVTHKKKWTEYLLEFFMLFLAVFLGFVAENIREGQVEKHREQEYIESLVNDLKKDTTNAQVVITDFQKFSPCVDSMAQNFTSMISGDSAGLWMYLRNSEKFTGVFEDFHIMDATMQQLKNSGSLRLIRNKSVVDSILAYDNLSKDAFQQEDLVDRLFEQYWEHHNECVDAIKQVELFKKLRSRLQPGERPKWEDIKKIMSPQNILATTDRSKLNSFYGSLVSLSANCWTWIDYLKNFKQQSTRLITFLQKEYHLEND
jgi:hypothetical protein